MKLLALDTATEQCSVALLAGERTILRTQRTPRGHADLVLPMVAEVLDEAGLSLAQLDAIAFGRGPGGFTGVRIAVGVAQGLALGTNLQLIPVSSLAAVAQQVARPGRDILVCMDARMKEVYWGVFVVAEDGFVTLRGEERVDPPENVQATAGIAVGTGFAAYPSLAARFTGLEIDADRLPSAEDIAHLAAKAWRSGGGVAPSAAAPVYLRDQVARPKRS